MPTRFYLPSGGTPPASPAYDSAWLSVAMRWPCSTTPANTALAEFSYLTKAATGPQNMGYVQFVSTDTFAYAGTVGGGTLSAVVAAREGSDSTDAFLQIVARVVSGDGGTVRGTFYPGATQTATSGTVGAQNREYASGGPEVTRTWRDIPIGTVDVQVGDRVVIEVGYRSVAAGDGHIANAFFGDPTATADYSLDDDLGRTAGRPWVEFSEDLFAAPTDPPDAEGALVGVFPVPVVSFVGDVPLQGGLAATLPRPVVVASGIAPTPGSLTVSLPVPTATAVGTAPIPGALVASLPVPALAATGENTVPPVGTDTTTDVTTGYGYDGYGTVGDDLSVEPVPAGVHLAKIMRVHQSLPAPTLVDGRPT